jgi:DNA polymerase V
MQTIDQINKNYSTAKVKIGQQDIKRTWKMRQQHLSKKFTTNINDIITVKCQ